MKVGSDVESLFLFVLCMFATSNSAVFFRRARCVACSIGRPLLSSAAAPVPALRVQPCGERCCAALVQPSKQVLFQPDLIPLLHLALYFGSAKRLHAVFSTVVDFVAIRDDHNGGALGSLQQ